MLTLHSLIFNSEELCYFEFPVDVYFTLSHIFDYEKDKSLEEKKNKLSRSVSNKAAYSTEKTKKDEDRKVCVVCTFTHVRVVTRKLCMNLYIYIYKFYLVLCVLCRSQL